jgi:exosome complex component MTR3
VACAALADAGVALNGLGVGVGCALATGDEKKVITDPTGVESRSAEARVTLGVMPALDTLTDVWMTGQASVEEVLKMVDRAVTGSAGVHGKVAATLASGRSLEVSQ